MTHVILCVDPDERRREETASGLVSAFDDAEVAITAASSFEDAVAALEKRAVDCVVSEYDLPDGTGLDLFERVRSASPDAGCILFTARDHEDLDTAAFGETITEYLRRDAPHAVERLAELVRTTVTAGTQTSYPLPPEEAERRAALRTYDLDFAELGASLERIVDLAAEHFGVPSASVNVVGDHEQTFLACRGAPVEWEPIPREDSICTFTILENDDVMRVEDAAEDPRFSERTEYFLGRGIRSYMGANLRTSSGYAIGSLCVYDEKRRAYDDDEAAYLRTLADVAMDLIETHYRYEQPATGDDDAEGRPG